MIANDTRLRLIRKGEPVVSMASVKRQTISYELLLSSSVKVVRCVLAERLINN